MYKGAPECTMVHQSILESTRVYQTIPECTKVYQSMPEYTRVYQSVPECTWVHESIQECTKVQAWPRCPEKGAARLKRAYAFGDIVKYSIEYTIT